MSRKKTYIVAYDIVDDTKRARVANTLKDYGLRVQKSVFQCSLSSDTFREMKQRIAKIINLHEDSVLIYPLCEACIKND
jgi:CRISPR-associated protein Cas2